MLMKSDGETLPVSYSVINNGLSNLTMHLKMFLWKIISFIAALVSLNFELCFCTCSRAEYEIDGECCPMCAPGNHVYWDCTVDTSTTCIPCPESTYTDQPNGLKKCISCSVCDAVKGLRVRMGCTRTADIICEPLEGFYCINTNKHGCTLAVQHSECNPGQYIKQTATPVTDTVCANCTHDTFSNGSLLACQPHSKCEVEGLKEIKAGTSSSDAECEKSAPVSLTAGLTVCVVMAAVIGSVIYFILKHRKRRSNKRFLTQPESDLEPKTPDSATPFI